MSRRRRRPRLGKGAPQPNTGHYIVSQPRISCQDFVCGAGRSAAFVLHIEEEIAALVRSVDRPVNVVMGLQGAQLSLGELAALGVKRVSVGGSLCRAAFGALFRAGREMQTHGTFTYAEDAISHREMCELFARARP